MKHLTILLLLICPFWAYTQNETKDANSIDQKSIYQSMDSLMEVLANQVDLLSSGQQAIKQDMRGYSSYQSEMRVLLDSLRELLAENSSMLNTLQSETKSRDEALKEDLQITEKQTQESVSKVESATKRRVLYIFGALILLLFGGYFGYRQLKKSLSDSQSGLLQKIKSTREELETESIRLDEKLVEVMENQLALIKAEREHNDEDTEIDHSLALKVADEIVRIEKNISRMDEGTKGLKQLSKAVGRIKDNFAANGYEMVDLIGVKYDDGMKLVANFRPDDNLKSGERVITRIIKPQVNYNGKMIQSAQVEVSQG